MPDPAPEPARVRRRDAPAAFAALGAAAVIVLSSLAARAEDAPPSSPPAPPPASPPAEPADAARHPLLLLRRAALRSSHLSIVRLLRSIWVAQAAAMSGARQDTDGDGVGEAWTLGELMGDGAEAVRLRGSDGRPLLPRVLADADAQGVWSAHGYRIRLYLPGAGGVALSAAGGARPDGVVADLAETTWCVYAWPAEPGVTGRFTYALAASGDVVASEVPPAAGSNPGPLPGDVFDGPADVIAPSPVLGRAVRGRTWTDARTITPQQIDVPDPPKSPVWRDDAALAAALADALGAVAQASGAADAAEAFGAKLPTVRTGTPGELRRILEAEMAPFFERMRMDARSRTASLDLMAISLFAKYDAPADAIVVVPSTIEVVASLLGDGGVLEPDCVRALLCHEAVHALDARRTGLLDRARAAASSAEMQALAAVIEGHAQHVGLRAAARIGVEAEFRAVTSLVQRGPADARGGGAPQMRAGTAAARFPYREGAAFFDRVSEALGAEGVARALADPPTDPRWIERPSLWMDREGTAATRLVVDDVLRCFGDGVPAGWSRNRETPTISAIREQTAAFGIDDPAGCFERVADTAALTFSEGAEFLVAGVLAFDDAASARAFVALERRLAEARPRPPAAEPVVWVEDPAELHGHVARHRAAGAAPVDVWTVQSGRFVIEVSVSSARVGAKVEEMVRAAARAAAPAKPGESRREAR